MFLFLYNSDKFQLKKNLEKIIPGPLFNILKIKVFKYTYYLRERILTQKNALKFQYLTKLSLILSQ